MHCRLSAVARVASRGGGRQKWAERAPSWSVLSCHFFRFTGVTLFTQRFRLSFSSLSCPAPHRPGVQEDRCCLPFVGQRLRRDTACVLVPQARGCAAGLGGAGGREARPASRSSQSTFDPNSSTVACQRPRLYRGVEGTCSDLLGLCSCPCSHARSRGFGGLGFFSLISVEEPPLPGTRTLLGREGLSPLLWGHGSVVQTV